MKTSVYSFPPSAALRLARSAPSASWPMYLTGPRQITRAGGLSMAPYIAVLK